MQASRGPFGFAQGRLSLDDTPSVSFSPIQPSLRDFALIRVWYPALKCRAIFGCAYGTRVALG